MHRQLRAFQGTCHQLGAGYNSRGLEIQAAKNTFATFCSRPASFWWGAEGLIQFLVTEKSFAEDRIRKAIDRINAAKGKSTQGGLPLPLSTSPWIRP